MSISARIRQIRSQKGYTQEFMATSLHMSQSNYHKIETEKNHDLSVNTLLDIIKVLEVKLTDIIPDPARTEAIADSVEQRLQRLEMLLESKNQLIVLLSEQILTLEEVLKKHQKSPA